MSRELRSLLAWPDGGLTHGKAVCRFRLGEKGRWSSGVLFFKNSKLRQVILMLSRPDPHPGRRWVLPA